MEYYVSEFIEMQRRLREAHGWDEHTPEVGRNYMLWTMGELGEVADVIKKKGDDAVMDNPAVRAHFVEETADVFMYLFDMMDCYGVTGEEFSAAYREKWERNMSRTWAENDRLYEDGEAADFASGNVNSSGDADEN